MMFKFWIIFLPNEFSRSGQYWSTQLNRWVHIRWANLFVTKSEATKEKKRLKMWKTLKVKKVLITHE